MNILELTKDMLYGAALWVDVELPFKATVHKGAPRVLVVVGENCSGKSFLVESLRSWASGMQPKVYNIQISIRERTGAGLYEQAAMRRAMMFGDESEHSTGATSISVLERAFSSMQDRHDSGYPCLLVLDEPELGLSDGYAGAMGTWLARKAKALPESSVGIVIVTHSRSLVTQLARELGEIPSLVRMGAAGDLTDWLEQPEVRSVEDLIALDQLDTTSWRAVRNALAEVRKNSSKD